MKNSGISTIELLISLVITSIISLAMVTSFSKTTVQAHDNEIKARVGEQARTILDYMAYDLRMTGAGMPIGQTGFAIDDVTLGDAALPILLTSDDDYLQLRLNEKGVNTVITADYLPSSANLTFNVLSTNNIAVGNTIYLTDITIGGTSGLQGVVQSVNTGTNAITILNTYVSTPSVTFKSGSLVARVTTVTYDSPADWSGITRNSETGAVILQTNSRFSLVYLDNTGTALAFPLTATTIKNNLFSLRITITVQSNDPLSTGVIYTAQARQDIAVRNLILGR